LVHPTHVSYDEIPYEFNAFAVSHPDRLATIATLFGMNPQSPARCRVLELGCAMGGNLIPMAINLPHSQFLGIDASARQIADGRAIIEKLGVQNIDLRHASILEVDDSYEMFDYIICHGVYSWVPREAQDKILSICSKNLKPMGFAYVSYNVYPGWHMSGMIRDMMIYHAGRFSAGRDRIAQARALLDFLSKSVPSQLNAYNTMLKESLDYLRNMSDPYLLHEYLEEYNEPLYFYQFIERAAAAQLRFLSESNLSEMLISRFPPEAQKTIQKISLGDIIRMEQYMDFLGRRTFRQTLLCHENIPINRILQIAPLHSMFITANFKPVSETPSYATEGPEQFKGPRGQITLTDPYVKTAMALLFKAAPMPIGFNDLCVAARKIVSRADDSSSSKEKDIQSLGNIILSSFTMGNVNLQLIPPTFTTTLNEKPKAFPLARIQAETGTLVTNARHEMITLGEFDRRVLQALDGTRDRNSIIKILMDLLDRGVLVAKEHNEPVQDQDRRTAILERELPGSLKRLCNLALIVNHSGVSHSGVRA
jgi:methyltransferase-like protein/ubiquinone/menaquinone biosynthesis C-methylase UbiE